MKVYTETGRYVYSPLVVDSLSHPDRAHLPPRATVHVPTLARRIYNEQKFDELVANYYRDRRSRVSR